MEESTLNNRNGKIHRLVLLVEVALVLAAFAAVIVLGRDALFNPTPSSAHPDPRAVDSAPAGDDADGGIDSEPDRADRSDDR